MAVTVSTETHETTTMVIQSDLDVIVKSSRDEVFVFAQNMRTGKPWPGVRLLISNGSKVFAEAATGPDGVFHQAFQELRELADAADIRVFAIADGHAASNVVALSGVAVARGLTDKGYIYTDRPAYRAGQAVHVRGCIRRVSGDTYTIDQGKPYTLEVFDPRNRLLRQDRVVLGAFGSFHTQFALPPTCPQGQYRLLVRDDQGRNFQGTFRVHEFKLEPVHLTVDVPRRVYYRGESIEGTIKAAYYYGAPLVGREISYQLADDRLHVARTDENGEVPFKLPTREFSETQVLPLKVTLPEHNLQTTANFMLSAQGFNVKVGCVRPVYVAGETFEVTVNAHDAEGKPAGRKLTLKVLEQTTVDGKVGERLVEEHEIETDAEEGVARTTLKLDTGGRYVLRAEGIDRFGNPVSGRHIVRISDDEDRIRLRILADRHTYKVGETASVKLHWREEPALALVTFEGARVLKYRLVELQKGPNELSIPMTAELAPNFNLAVAIMTNPQPVAPKKPRPVVAPDKPQPTVAPKKPRPTVAPKKPRPVVAPKKVAPDTKPPIRFHTASSPFTVQRDLHVSIAVRRKDGADGPVRPGEELEVTLTTTDPQGNPLAAEVSLAMVEQSLLDRFAWPAPPIHEFFRGQLRQPAIRTTSSITFAYSPSTQAIDPQFLEERQRLEIAKEEEASLTASRLAVAADSELYGRGHWSDFGGEDPFGAADEPPAASPFGIHFGAAGGGPAEDQTVREQIVELLRERGYAAAAIGGRISLGVAVDPDAGLQIAETGYWNPAITTGEDGKATVTLTVPERSTAWQLVAKGITTETLAGEATDELTVKKDLFGQLKLPLAFTDGDRAEIVASIHNDAVEKGPIEVTLKTTIGDRTVEQKKTVDVDTKGIHEATFSAELDLPERTGEQEGLPAAGDVDVLFELTVSAGDRRDVVRRAVPLRPYGMPVFAAVGGSATSDTTVWIEPPEGVPIQSPGLQIVIGPTLQQSLLDILFGRPLPCQIESSRIAAGVETTTSDLMAALALQKLLGASRDAAGPHAVELDRRVRASLALLVSSQNDDGGWSWTGRGGASDRDTSARVLWAASLAREAGYTVPNKTFQGALGYLQQQMAATDNTDYRSKAVLLHALSTAARGDFSLANRLYRNRPALSPAALAYLALAFAEMDRKATARELLGEKLEAGSEGRGAGEWTANDTPVELRALYALGLQEVTPAAPEAKQLVDWLMAHRTGHRFSPERATGPAAMALCAEFARRSGLALTPGEGIRRSGLALTLGEGGGQGEQKSSGQALTYKLAVFVNDVRAAVLDVDETTGTRTIDVPKALLKKEGKQRINFQITGRGQYTYQCILGGFVPAEKLQSTVDDWRVTRTYQPAPLEVDGKEIRRGFGVLEGSYVPFVNPVTQLPVGRRAMVELSVRRKDSTSNAADLEYLVITEPIPSGTTVIEQSVRGPLEHFEIAPGAITFYVGDRRDVGTIRYELYGYLPGEYRAAPTVIRNAYHPGQLAISKTKSLAVLPSGTAGTDAYRLTPDELYALGKQSFQTGQWKTAEKHLTELFDNWKLNPNTYKSVVKMLLDVHLEVGPAGQVVRYFEIVKEKWPDEEIPFAKIVKIGAAYHEMGEYERSYLIFRATVETSFLRESGVAGFLDSQGEFVRSVDVMQRLLREYPPEAYVAAATYALAQRVYAKAPQAADDEKLRRQKINRVDLVRRASEMLEGFLTAYPEDPAADQAAFSKANTLLELKEYGRVVAACNRYAKRYPRSDLLDTYWYIIGYCHFAAGQPEAALAMCQKVAEAKRIDRKTGRQIDSPNKWRAVYIMGQVYHSLGRAAEAVREYQRVKDRFSDAARSIAYFLRKGIELPEVTTLKPGEPVEVELKFRNIATCDVKVYRIDLMKFTLMQRNLGGIARINLAGIRPQHAATVTLGDGKDYRDRTHKLALPLEKEGAYLVVCRGEDLHASGLVLLTPLKVEVDEDRTAGHVRTTVKDRTTDQYLGDVHVKVIGTGNTKFVSGTTDLRGVFTAKGIRGAATVIAMAEGGRYAFYRGESERGKRPQPISTARRGTGRTLPQHRPVDLTAEGPEEAEAKINAALDSPTQLEFIETPLQDVVDYLKELHGIEIQIDFRALEEVGIPTDTPLTKNLKGVTLRSALRLLLRELDLTYVIQDEVLLITTPEEAECHLTTKVYPVADLVRFRDESGEEWADFDSLIEILTSTVEPTTWDCVGGSGSIAPFENNLSIVVSQTQEGHREIERVLENLRRVGANKSGDGKPPIRKKPPQGGYGGFGGMGMGGMGMGGGMGYFGGGGAAPAQRPFVTSVVPVVGPDTDAAPAAGGMNELLQGLQEANESFQGRQVDRLQKIYSRGMGMGGFGGVAPGAAF